MLVDQGQEILCSWVCGLTSRRDLNSTKQVSSVCQGDLSYFSCLNNCANKAFDFCECMQHFGAKKVMTKHISGTHKTVQLQSTIVDTDKTNVCISRYVKFWTLIPVKKKGGLWSQQKVHILF